MHLLHRLRPGDLPAYRSTTAFLTMKQLLLATAAATTALLLPTAALAERCRIVASHWPPNAFACQDSGRKTMYGQTVWICCE